MYWTTWWNQNESKYISNGFSIPTHSILIYIMIIIQKLQQLLRFSSWTSYHFVVSGTDIIYLFDIWDIFRSFMFQSCKYISGLHHVQCHVRNKLTLFGIKATICNGMTNWLCNTSHDYAYKKPLNVDILFVIRYPRNLKGHSHFLFGVTLFQLLDKFCVLSLLLHLITTNAFLLS